MKPMKVNVMGMELDEWSYKSCHAHFGVGGDWATLYNITSDEEGKGHATKLLTEAKKYYEKKGKLVGSSVALHPAKLHLINKLN